MVYEMVLSGIGGTGSGDEVIYLVDFDLDKQ